MNDRIRQASTPVRSDAERIRRAREAASGRRPPDGAGPGPDPAKPDGSRGGRGGRGFKAALAIAAAVLIGIGAYAGFGPGGGDRIDGTESQSRMETFEAFSAAGGLRLDMVTNADVDKAIETLPADVRETVRQDVGKGAVRLAWVQIWDTHAEDGDVVRFDAPGTAPVQITAFNTPTTIAIPFPPDGRVMVTGVTDGGGGITIAVRSGAQEIAWPTMAPGDQFALPVTPGM